MHYILNLIPKTFDMKERNDQHGDPIQVLSKKGQSNIQMTQVRLRYETQRLYGLRWR